MKRFYKQVTIEKQDTGWQVTLDGRGIKTPGRAEQIVPTRALAEAMATEWSDQGEEIDTARFPLRDVADYAIDTVGGTREALVRELVAYAETDTLCYRAEPGEALHERQMQVWEPLVADAEARWDVHFERISGIIHQPQPDETLARMQTILAAKDAFTLAGLQMLASLSASLLVALAAIERDADAEALWAAANLEEDWQAELWGRDAEAEARRQQRLEAFATTMRFAALAHETG